ncbi:SpoIIE family protein phosphatase [Stutzerimonas tarimensis]|uniref:SpoIIE family protein phosphatase n=1 Tax=Stutzerimonas tarimensis TaxID=1507735 RepID=A0ABV7T783_9GAMM
MTTTRLSILVADDNPTDRLILCTLLSRQGHEPLPVSNGEEAVEVFRQKRPQLVLMDVLMPVMDGFDASRRIKSIAGDELVPLIFLTSLAESEALVSCLEAGGDDFLPKPYSPIILEAKILAMNRLRLLQAMVLEQRDLIARQHRQLLHEQRLAKTIFDKVAHTGCLDSPNIRYLQSPLALFNGDLLLAAQSPAGHLFVLLGDFTGHGLPAAIGAMPLAESFYRMAAKGYSGSDIIHELNAKLVRILPVEVFCCAMLLDIDMPQGLLRVWNGGLPDGYLLREDGTRIALSSRHLPLGVLDPGRFVERLQTVSLQAGDRLLMLSDGMLESRNVSGELFGEARLLAVLEANRDRSALFEEIQHALAAFRGEHQDDLSLVEICPGEAMSWTPLSFPGLSSVSAGPLDWSTELQLRGETLRNFNPLPLILQLLLQVRELRPRAGAVYTVLAELYANALEHGVLGLDSRLKRDSEGFARYYELREQRLRTLDQGEVRIALDFTPAASGGRLRVRLSDSGPGFDVRKALASPCEPVALSGRGLRLVTELSDGIEWEADGSALSAVFNWTSPT